MNKKYLLAGIIGLILVIALVGVLVVKGQSGPNTTAEPTPTPDIVQLLPQDALSVTLKPGTNHQYVLTIDKIPDGVTSVSYEITYDTSSKGTQGVVGSPVELSSGQTKYVNDKLIFGSCSRNVCVYDQGVSNIQINIRLQYKDGSEK